MELNIKTKLIIVGTLLAFIPTLIVSIILSNNALENATLSLRAEVENKLTAIRSTTANNIENYFSFIEQQVVTMSSDRAMADTMKKIIPAYRDYTQTLTEQELSQRKKSLSDYYYNEFNENFKTLNGGQSANPENLLANASKQTIAFQSAYISNNPAPLGEKDNLARASDNHTYHDIHASIHPNIRQYLQAFGYYDIFLIDIDSGDIVYSVFKELDFATSLKTGPYADTGIGHAFKKALTATSSEQFFITDFQTYLPSYNAAASFISSAIFDGNTMVGVLIFQMPVDRINEVMTHKNNWKDVGLGDSGETYLVGSNYTMRSNGRFLVEDKPAYLQLMQEIGLSDSVIADLDNKNTTIGLQPVKTKGTKTALAGNTGFDIFPDYRGISVLSAYTILDLGELKWALMSEIDEEEAFDPILLLEQSTTKSTLIACSIALLVGGILGWLFSKIILKPISEMQDTVYDIAQGENNLTMRLALKGNNEVTQLSKGINTFIDKIDTTFSDLLKSVARMVPMSQDLSEVNHVLNKTSTEQKDIADIINNCLLDTNQSATLVDHKLSEITDSTSHGQHVVDESETSIKQAASSMGQLSSNMDSAVQAIDKLQHDTNRITSIIDVINSIAEQTNLLALNAAIEAARAGEAGRGFAVVADEVRSLASKTSESTNQVTDMVNAIQSGTDSVVEFIQHGQQSVINTNEQVDSASEQLHAVSHAMTDILTKVTDISEAIAHQKSTFDQVNAQYDVMNKSFLESFEGSQAANRVGEDLNKLGEKLLDMIKHFKVSDDTWTTQKRAEIRKE